MSPRENKKSTAELPESSISAPSLGQAFFEREIHRVAQDLLGRDLVRFREGVKLVARIVEVEVYEGANDPASHARQGVPTARTQPMFADPGTLYVYTIYGIYQCLNVRVPSKTGPGAILIRACEPRQGHQVMARGRGLIDREEEYRSKMAKKLLSGPAKICQALDIDTGLSGEMIGDDLWLSPGSPVAAGRIESTPRIGLNPRRCGECVEWPWRYVVRDSTWASR